MGDLVDWCKPDGFTDRLCIKSGQPADGGSVQYHADFDITPNKAPDGTYDGTYSWIIGFSFLDAFVEEAFREDLHVANDSIMLKYAIIPAPVGELDLNPEFINSGGQCSKTAVDEYGCQINKYAHHEYVKGPEDEDHESWENVEQLASGKLEKGQTLIWWLHVNVKELNADGIQAKTSFALPCEDITGTSVDSTLQTINEAVKKDGDKVSFTLSGPLFEYTDSEGITHSLTMVDPLDGEYKFDHLKFATNHGWGWKLLYTAPDEDCVTPETPVDPEPENNPPTCIDEQQIDIVDANLFCESEIKVVASNDKIHVGQVTLRMEHIEGSGFLYTVHLSLLDTYTVPPDPIYGDIECSIKPFVVEGLEEGTNCENVKTQVGPLSTNSKGKGKGKNDVTSIADFPIGKYNNKCCLPQEEMEEYGDILIAEGVVTYTDEPTPLAIHLDTLFTCDVEHLNGDIETPFDEETAYGMEIITNGCNLIDVDLSYGWGGAFEIPTSNPTR